MSRTRRPSLLVAALWTAALLMLATGAFGRIAASPQESGAAPQAEDTAGVMQEAGDSARASGVGGPAPDTVVGAGDPQQTTLGETRSDVQVPLYQRLVSVLGLITLLVLAWAFSVDRRLVDWRVLAWGLGLQLLFALFILKTPVGEALFAALNDVIIALLGFTTEGARFLFGNLVDNAVPVTGAGEGAVAQTGAFFAFSVLPTIIFFSSLMTLLYYLGIMQAVVKGMAWVMMRTMRTSGAETLSAAGNIFVGQTEAPLLIKPFVERMTTSELMALDVVASPEAEFDAWLDRQRQSAAEPDAALLREGRDVFMLSGCAICHTVRGTEALGRTGPDLTHVASRRTLAALAIPNTRGHLGGWLVNPQAIKPGTRMPPTNLGSEDLHALLSYLETLK